MNTIEFRPRAEKSLAKLPTETAERILNSIQELMENYFPTGKKVKKLKNDPGYRLRVGDYRVVYDFEPQQKLITIRSIFHGHSGY